ncbi:MAG TPA: PQQ-binding-like beta-propeller repeat protein [Gemmataceae bacterium]|nr:PQQ-binding-like beta-propeller repeat protein [Gemmataceae bacterium]
MRRANTTWLCILGTAFFLTAASVRADDWPQWLGPQRDGVWRETGILDKFPKGGPKQRWRMPVGGGYAGPAVADGRVYVADRVLAADAKDPDNPFLASNSDGEERLWCLDEIDGHVLWKKSYPCKYQISYSAGPRATPTVADGKVYFLGAMGNLHCYDAKSGNDIWAKDFVKDPAYKAPVPTWGFAAHPLVDGDKVICLVGGPGSVVVAFDKGAGAEKWRSLSMETEQIGYCPPMIYSAAGVRQLIIWTPEAVNGLDPETGKPYWSQAFKLTSNLSIPTPRLDGDKLFVTAFYNGSMMLQLTAEDGNPSAKLLWKGKGRGEMPKLTDTLHSIMCTPYIRDGCIYGVCSFGQLRCIKEEDGSRVWEDLRATGSVKEPTERWANAFLTPQGDRWFLFNEKGDLIIARLTPTGYEEIDRAHLLEPTNKAMGRSVVWSHPAYADKCIFVRNDKEIVCYSLAAD